MKRVLLVVIGVLVAVVAPAQEKITLTAPVFVDPGATEFRVASAYFNNLGHEVRAVLSEVDPGTHNYKDNGRTLVCTYADTQADNLMKALNKADFTVTSMQKQLMQKCQNDGKLGPGTISGVPQ